MDENRLFTSLLDSSPVGPVQIDELVLEGSPRSAGEDPEHTRALADIETGLPPITVHRRTMRVIDGMHRVRAAMLRNQSVIEARLLDCDEDMAFVLAVHANVAHGLPLSQADRKTAAANIISRHPHWSDRAVAAATGLSDKSVSALRSSTTADLPQSNTRLGRDGRMRPVNSAARRRQAAAMMTANPGAGLREIARATGLSPATVRDVRRRTEDGEDPVPERYREPEDRPAGSPASPAAGVAGPVPGIRPEDLANQRHTAPYLRGTSGSRQGRPISLVGRSAPRVGPGRQTAHVDRQVALAKIARDPSVRFTETGRSVLRWLFHHTVDIDDCLDMATRVPEQWLPLVAELAGSCASAWSILAKQLEQRSVESAGRAPSPRQLADPAVAAPPCSEPWRDVRTAPHA